MRERAGKYPVKGNSEFSAQFCPESKIALKTKVHIKKKIPIDKNFKIMI